MAEGLAEYHIFSIYSLGCHAVGTCDENDAMPWLIHFWMLEIVGVRMSK
jgi:hypothetical protein